MDAESVQMLRTLPDDLRERGWQMSEAESELLTWEIPRHRAVYVRPVDGRLDIHSPHAVAYDKVTRQQIVRVSTLSDQSASWHDARRDAIRRMRDADARRRRKR